MSTRSQIKVIHNGKSVELYHHCDGYPEGVGFCLLKILELEKEHKGWHPSELVTEMVKKGNFEITFSRHRDIEYYYELNFDKEVVNCMEVDNWGDSMEILKHIDLQYDAEKDVYVDEEIFK